MAETRWFYKETYCGCVIQETYEGSGIFGSPCTVYLRFEISRVKADIRAKGYCDEAPPPPPPPPPPSGEGKASIIEVNLPSELSTGELIIGYFRVKNIGTVEDRIRCLVTTTWNGRQYSGENTVPVNGVLRFAIIDTHNIRMPNQDAIIKIEGQHKKDGVWVTDDTKTH